MGAGRGETEELGPPQGKGVEKREGKLGKEVDGQPGVSHHSSEQLEGAWAEGLPGSATVKNRPANAGDTGDAVQLLGQEDLLEQEMATHSSILAWKIPRATVHGVTKSQT